MVSKKINVAIIDYKMGNMFSVQSACNYVGLNPIITNDKHQILNSDAVILPGVGAFAEAMHHIKELNLTSVIKKFIETNKPFVGVCLGMQLLFTESEEFSNTKGLNLIPGKIKKFCKQNPNGKKIKTPQIGWNQISKTTETQKGTWAQYPLNDIQNKEYMYFVHSFYADPENENVILTKTNYEGIEYCSSIIYKNIFACQFHPEKSAREGLKIYKNLATSLENQTN